jgi:hypothetical protein
MRNSHQLQQLLTAMQSSRLTLAHDLTLNVRTAGTRSPLSMPVLGRFGVPIGIALGAIAILRMGLTRR